VTDEERKARLSELLAEEAKCPPSWWYLSYAGSWGFRGGAIIEARGFTSACQAAAILDISPGGEVRGFPVPPDKIPAPQFCWRLLTKEELEDAWGEPMMSLKDLEEENGD
jgi:hypothetical protein